MPTPQVSRRGVFGYAGAATLGGAAGVVAGRVWGGPGSEPTPVPVSGRTYPAHGAIQAGITTPKPAVGELVAFDLLPGTDRAALARLMRVWSSDIAALMAGRPAAGDSAPDLAQAIDTFQPLDYDSHDERAIRAASLIAVEKIAEQAGVPVAAVDHYLWMRRKEASTPFHLTFTTAY